MVGVRSAIEEPEPGIRPDTMVKPEILGSNFAFNPQNFAYLKYSQKFRSNTVGKAHSSASLL